MAYEAFGINYVKDYVKIFLQDKTILIFTKVSLAILSITQEIL